MLPVMAIQSWWWWWWWWWWGWGWGWGGWRSSSSSSSSSWSSWCHITSCCGFWMWASPRFDCARELLLGTDERRPVASERFGEVLGLLSLPPGRNVSPFTSCHRNSCRITAHVLAILKPQCLEEWRQTCWWKASDEGTTSHFILGQATGSWFNRSVHWLIGDIRSMSCLFSRFQMISAFKTFKRSFSNKFSLASIVHILSFYEHQWADVTVLQWWFWYIVLLFLWKVRDSNRFRSLPSRFLPHFARRCGGAGLNWQLWPHQSGRGWISTPCASLMQCRLCSTAGWIWDSSGARCQGTDVSAVGESCRHHVGIM